MRIGIAESSLRKRRVLRDFWEGPIPFAEQELLRKIGKGVILDFGCGRGAGMRRFRERGWDVIGVDPRFVDLKIAKTFGHVVCAMGEWSPFVDGTFDVVISSHVLHHMTGPHEALREIFRCLKLGGYLLLAETVEDNPLLRFARNIDPYYEGVRVKSRYTRKELRRLIERNHFILLEEYSWGLCVWAYADLAKRSKTLARISYFLPSVIESLENSILTRAKPLTKYCAHYYALVYKGKSH